MGSAIEYDTSALAHEEEGYHKGLKPRQLQMMIAIGGAIGTGLSVIADNGGILPTGVLQLVIITSGVIFAYAAVELVGTAAGEPKTRPR